MGRGESAVMSTCMQRDHVPIFDADEAITNGVFARLQMAAHNSAPRSTSEVASVPDEGCNRGFIIEVIRLSSDALRCDAHSDVSCNQCAISVQSVCNPTAYLRRAPTRGPQQSSRSTSGCAAPRARCPIRRQVCPIRRSVRGSEGRAGGRPVGQAFLRSPAGRTAAIARAHERRPTPHPRCE